MTKIVSSAFPAASRTPLRTASSSTTPQKCEQRCDLVPPECGVYSPRGALSFLIWIGPHSPAFSIRLAAHGIEWRPPPSPAVVEVLVTERARVGSIGLKTLRVL